MKRLRARECLLLLLAVVIWGGCRAESDFDSQTATLQHCPGDDGPWRQILNVAESENRVAELEQVARDLANRCSDLWAPQWMLGRTLTSLERYQDAEKAYRKALDLAQRESQPVGIARSSDELAWFAYLGARHHESEELFQQALDAARTAKRRDLEIFIRSNHAGLLRDIGDLAGASNEYRLVVAGIEELGLDEKTRRIAQFNQGSLLIELGDAAGAEASFQEIYDTAHAAGDTDFADGAALALGNLFWAREKFEASERWLNRVSANSTVEHAKARLGIGLIQMERDDPQAAFDSFTASAEEAAHLDRPFALLARAYSARAALALGNGEKAEKILNTLFDGIEGHEPLDAALWERHWFLGLIAERAGNDATARKHLETAAEIVSAQRLRLDPSSDGLRFLRERSEPFVDLALLLMNRASRSPTDSPGRILEVLQAAKTMALRDRLEQSLDSGDEQLAAIRKSLKADEVVLDYLIGNKRGVVLAIRKDAVTVRAIEGRDEILPALRVLRAAVQDNHAASFDMPARQASRILSRGLLGSLTDALDGIRRIYIVPHRELAVLTWSVLPWPISQPPSRIEPEESTARSGFLGHRYELASLPWAAPPPVMTDTSGRVLLAGQPVALDDSHFDPLPWVAFELSSLRRIWTPEATELLTKREFSLDSFRKRSLEPFGIVHIASHAVASTTDPRRCGIILSEGKRLGLDDIAALSLNSSLVVLSACRTGEGEVVPGEGVIGLGWALLKAGALGAVVSRWTVDDNSSARLMIDFHEALRDGADPVAALARARRSAFERNPHPAHWAAFDIMMRPRSESKH